MKYKVESLGRAGEIWFVNKNNGNEIKNGTMERLAGLGSIF